MEHHFAGIFDGKGHTVSGLYINGGSQKALFGFLTGAIINLNVSGTVIGDTYCAGFVALNASAIICTFSGTIETSGIQQCCRDRRRQR